MVILTYGVLISSAALSCFFHGAMRIAYCNVVGVRVTVDKCFVTFGPVPGEDFFFSDHQAVAAVLSLASCRSSGGIANAANLCVVLFPVDCRISRSAGC